MAGQSYFQKELQLRDKSTLEHPKGSESGGEHVLEHRKRVSKKEQLRRAATT